MAHAVFVIPAAARQLEKLEAGVWRRVRLAIDALAETPRPNGCKKLSATASAYRIRVGDHRVIYEVEDRRLVVLVIRVAHRREAYHER
ncbi:MAG: type II toxin-antitoxin system RelE/ParE family toxin [Thermoanaerobaculia bacterium]